MEENVTLEEISAMSGEIASKIWIEGYDREDLVLEGILEGVKSLELYDGTRGVKMSTYVYSSIKYRLFYLMRLSQAQKRRPEKKIPFEGMLLSESSATYGDYLSVEATQEEEYMLKELKEDIYNKMDSILNKEEIEILKALSNGYKASEIAKDMNVETRKLTNRISYIRRKMRNYNKSK